MVKEAAISCAIHLLIFAIMMSAPKSREIPLEMAGEQISINMVSMGSASEDVAEKRAPEEKRAEKPQEKREPVKRSEAERVEKPVEKPVERSIDKPVEKPVKRAAAEVETAAEPVEAAEKPVPAEIQRAADTQEIESSAAENPGDEQEGAEVSQKAGAAEGSESPDENLVQLADGSYSVKHQGVAGLSYGFISKPEPAYPPLARRMGFKEEVRVRVIMQFAGDGELESVKFVDERDRFGFANEVEKVVGMWRLTPIEYRGQLIKMRYYWTFKFEVPR